MLFFLLSSLVCSLATFQNSTQQFDLQYRTDERRADGRVKGMKRENDVTFLPLSHSSRPTASSERSNHRQHHWRPYRSHFAVGHNWDGDSNVPQTPQQQTEWRVSGSLPSRAWITAAPLKSLFENCSTSSGSQFVWLLLTREPVCVFSVVHPSTNRLHPRRPTALPTR